MNTGHGPQACGQGRVPAEASATCVSAGFNHLVTLGSGTCFIHALNSGRRCVRPCVCVPNNYQRTSYSRWETGHVLEALPSFLGPLSITAGELGVSAQVCGAGFAHTHGPVQLPTGRFMSQMYTFQHNAAPPGVLGTSLCVSAGKSAAPHTGASHWGLVRERSHVKEGKILRVSRRAALEKAPDSRASHTQPVPTQEQTQQFQKRVPTYLATVNHSER